ncbi:MAG TPA: DUF448 domain-containing protein [Candidatus Dormibacteraeota bacterium]|nr:DUF448 domain-containing protein [Candidatus Dormibacteraeota bacterium]
MPARPLRRCRVCRIQKPKGELMRWVKKNGTLMPDTTQRQPGRGYYVCSEAHAGKLAEIIRKTGR